MVTTLILHVGPHKTGTTALQSVLAANAALLAASGVLYPQTGRSGDSHAALATRLVRGDPAGLAPLHSEAQGWRAVVLSSELLADLAPAALTALRDRFPGAEVRVSYTLRRLTRLWPSHWAELVKHGQDPGFADYLDAVARRDDTPFHAPILPSRQLGNLADAFGPSALRIFGHDHLRASGQDLGPAFIDDLLGLGHIAPAFATTPLNSTPSETETALVWLLNRHAKGRANHQTKAKARRVLLDRLDAAPPWLADLRAAVAATDRIQIGCAHPLVAAEQRAVADRHRAEMAEGMEAYLAPITGSVPDLARLRLPADTRAALATAFDTALATARAATPPNGPNR